MPTSISGENPSAGGGANATDATTLLTQDHQEVKTLFEQYERDAQGDLGSGDQQALVERICMMLEAHARVEEEIFYPAARSAGVEAALLDEAESEHASAKSLIGRLRSAGPTDPGTRETMMEIARAIDHHVQEEESELFPRCRDAGMDLQDLARRLAQRKQAMMAQSGRP